MAGTAYMVVAGEYDDYQVLHVFEDEQTAHDWALRCNAELGWWNEDDKARVEPVGLTLAGRQAPPVVPVVVVDGEVREAGPRLLG